MDLISRITKIIKAALVIFIFIVSSLGLVLILKDSISSILTPPLKNAVVLIDQKKISVEIASSPDELYRGLSGRTNLCADCGMLFDFPDSEEQEFVMRDMKFPLDIIFINKGRISRIAADLPPEGKTPRAVYTSGGPADQVLEVNGSYAARNNFQIGDEVTVTGNK